VTSWAGCHRLKRFFSFTFTAASLLLRAINGLCVFAERTPSPPMGARESRVGSLRRGVSSPRPCLFVASGESRITLILEHCASRSHGSVEFQHAAPRQKITL
jgi:hypothetical protein